jgi:hypothetical protein
MTRHENETQKVVSDVVVNGGVKLVDGRFLRLDNRWRQLGMLSVEHLVASQRIHRAMLGCSHQPGGWIIGNAGLRPLLERYYQSVLSEIFSETNVVNQARQCGNELRRLHPPDSFDTLVRFQGRSQSLSRNHRNKLR